MNREPQTNKGDAMKVRLIQTSNENGNRETVTFCDVEDTSPAADYCLQDDTVDFDGIIEADLPDGFPMNYTLQRQ